MIEKWIVVNEWFYCALRRKSSPRPRRPVRIEQTVTLLTILHNYNLSRRNCKQFLLNFHFVFKMLTRHGWFGRWTFDVLLLSSVLCLPSSVLCSLFDVYPPWRACFGVIASTHAFGGDPVISAYQLQKIY